MQNKHNNDVVQGLEATLVALTRSIFLKCMKRELKNVAGLVADKPNKKAKNNSNLQPGAKLKPPAKAKPSGLAKTKAQYRMQT